MGRIFTPTESDFGKTDAVVIGGGIVGTATAQDWTLFSWRCATACRR
jgi:glycerol-3-phosphate dehydrogenase